ncbi:ataxin-7-like protein 1 [Stigmatopora argus]
MDVNGETAKIALKWGTLRRHLFPKLEDFHLVVCHVHNQVVAPQAFFTHYEKRYDSPSKSPVVLTKGKGPAAASGPGDAFRISKDYPHSRFDKAPLAVYPPKGTRSESCVSLPVVSLETTPCLGRVDATSRVRFGPSSSSPLKTAPPGEKLSNNQGNGGLSASPDGRPGPAPSPRPASRPAPLLLSSPSPEKKSRNGARASSGSHSRLSGRVFDPNKHCGVPDPESKQPCTRSLTCKAHSLTNRRAVPGRMKLFDVLLAEHRSRNKEAEEAKAKEKEKDTSQDLVGTKQPSCLNGRPLSTLKLKLANAHIPRVPGISTSVPQPPPPPQVPFPVPSSNPSPEPRTRAAGGDGEKLSSDEGDVQPPEDAHRPAFHFSNVHPQPSGFCIFSSRLMGRGHYVFDRRWDRMRLALQNVVQKHLNAQMWRKVPLAAENPPSQRAPPWSSSPDRLFTKPSSSVFPDPSPEDSTSGTKRKNSSSCVRNGTSSHWSSQASGGAVRKKGRLPEGKGLWDYNRGWFSKADGSHGCNSNSRELLASGALNYGPKGEAHLPKEKRRQQTELAGCPGPL